MTAGNASGVNDGAAALILASAEALKTHRLRPRARVLGMATAGVPPRVMGIGPVPATQKLLARLALEMLRLQCDRTQRGVRRPGARRHPAALASPTMPTTSTRTAARSRSAIRWARAAHASCSPRSTSSRRPPPSALSSPSASGWARGFPSPSRGCEMQPHPNRDLGVT